MINSINSAMPMPPRPRAEQNLSDEQQSLITETLSQFDVDNLSEKDAVDIVEAFSQAGIKPGGALEQSMAELGFNAKAIGELAGMSEQGNRPPPPPQQSSEEITSIVDYLTELMEEKYASSNSNELSDEDKQSILQQVFKKFEIEDGESIINTTA